MISKSLANDSWERISLHSRKMHEVLWDCLLFFSRDWKKELTDPELYDVNVEVITAYCNDFRKEIMTLLAEVGVKPRKSEKGMSGQYMYTHVIKEVEELESKNEQSKNRNSRLY